MKNHPLEPSTFQSTNKSISGAISPIHPPHITKIDFDMQQNTKFIDYYLHYSFLTLNFELVFFHFYTIIKKT